MALRSFSLVSLALISALAAQAQQGQIAGPLAGYVFDSAAHALRPVLGIPGAAVLGNPINLGIEPVSATVSPKLDSVLAVAADGSLHLLTLDKGVAAEVAVNGIVLNGAAAANRVVFSPAGTAAAVYSGGRIQILTGLPTAPVVASSLDIAPLLSRPAGRRQAPFTAPFAVSDDGSNLLVAAGDGVQLFASGNSRQISATRATALAFVPGTQDAVLAGTAVTLIKNGQQQTLAAADSSQSAVGAAFAGDKLYIANSQGVTAFDLPNASRSAIPCGCTPTSLDVMGNVYRLNDAGAAPLWLLDPATNKIVFVPAS